MSKVTSYQDVESDPSGTEATPEPLFPMLPISPISASLQDDLPGERIIEFHPSIFMRHDAKAFAKSLGLLAATGIVELGFHYMLPQGHIGRAVRILNRICLAGAGADVVREGAGIYYHWKSSSKYS